MDNLWTIRIFFDGDAADPAVYPLKSCSIPRCVGAAGTHAQQKATVSISGHTVSLSLKLVGRKEQTKAEIYEGTAIRFTGLIDTDWDFDAKGRLIESVSLTVMDYSGKLKIGVFGKDVAPENARLVRGPQRWQNYAVCDPASQDTSIVHQILKLAAGFLGITIPVKCDATCTTRLDYFQLEQDSDLKTQLEQLLNEFRLDYIFDADNSIRIISTDSNGEPVATVTDFRNSLRGSGSVYKPKSIKATWRKYERRVGEKIGEGYHKSNSVNSRSVEYGQDVTWSLPDGASLDDWEIVSIENLNPGSTWTETGVTHPRIDGASAKVTRYDLEGCHIVMERHGACAKGYIRARITADIVIRYNKTQELYSNPGTTQESLTLLHHHQLSSSDGIEGATEYAMYYEAMKRKASTTYTFSSLSEYAPGAIVTLSESSVTGISAKVRILEQTLDPLTGIYKYKAEGAGDLDLKEAITKAETSEDHPIYGGDFLELSADLDESTGVVTVVAEGDAIDYYGLTPAWDLNGTSVTSTGSSVTFPVRDLALSGNVVTCTATLNGETVTATYDIDQLLSAPTLAIFTGDGSLFPAGSVNATLSAVLMRSGVDVALANESVFRWTRVTTDTTSDKAWNESPKANGKRSVILTDSDLVDGGAVFLVSCVIGTTTYSSQGFSIQAVSDGRNGWSNATCQLFKRSATTPSAYDGSQLTYTFATATLTGDTGSWSRTIPSGDYPLYVIYASAFAAADTDIVETTDWTEPAILSENGTKGESGLSVKTILLYQRSEAAPALPTGQVTYNFDSGEISGQGAWSLDVPTTNGYPLWVTSATAASRSASDIIEPSEWSTPSIMAKDGEQGEAGASMTYMYASAPEGWYPGGYPFGIGQNVIGIADTAIGINYEWLDTVPDIAEGYVLWTKTVAPDGTVSIYRVQGPKGDSGATGRGISSITHYYATTATQSAPSASSITSTTIPAMSASEKYLWRKTVITYTDSTTSPSVELIAIYGDTGDSASIKNFDIDLSAKSFSVSPRGYTRTAQTIVATCTLIHVAVNAVTITWSSTSSQVTLTPSSDKTTCTISVAARVALLPFRVSCAVTGVGLTKTVSIDVQPETGNADSPIYLGTNWDTSKSWSNSNDPVWSGDYYLDTSTNTPMIASVSGSGTITYSAMQTGNPNTALIMGTVLSDILAQGSGVQSTCVAVNAYFGAIAAKTGFIESLRSQVIQSANYSEDSSGNPVTGYRLDGPNNVIKAANMRAVGGRYRDINIDGGQISISNADGVVFSTNSTEGMNTEITATGIKDAWLVSDLAGSLTANAETASSWSYNGETGDAYYLNAGDDAYKARHKESTLTNLTLNSSNGSYYYRYAIPNIGDYISLTFSCSETCYLSMRNKNGSTSGSPTYTIGAGGGSGIDVVGMLGYGSLIELRADGWREFVLTSKTGKSIEVTAFTCYYAYYVTDYECPPETLMLLQSKTQKHAFSLNAYKLKTQKLAIGSKSSDSYISYTSITSLLALLVDHRGNFTCYQGSGAVNTYTDGTPRSIGGTGDKILTVSIDSNSITITHQDGILVLGAGDFVKGAPALRFIPKKNDPGATVLNLNASTDSSKIGSNTNAFANTWTQNINNVPVTDSNNQSLAVSGAGSIVGAINQINRDLGDIGTIVENTYGKGIKLRNGLIVNFGYGFYNSKTAQVTYPIPFRTYGIPVANTYGVNESGGWIPKMKSFSVTGFTYYKGFDDEKVVWIAIGY